MEWNNLLTELNYYLTNLYIADKFDIAKLRIIKNAGLPAGIISFDAKPINTWFSILEVAAARDKVVELLNAITKPEEGNNEDGVLLGAISKFKSGVFVSRRNGTIDNELPKWSANNISENKEKILGKRSTLLPVGFLEKGTDCAKAVVRIRVGEELGTGFIIRNNWLLTNNHVLPRIEDAKQAYIEFGYQFPKNIKLSQNRAVDIKAERTIRLHPGETESDRLFFTNEKDDWTIVKIEEDIKEFGFLNLSSAGVNKEDFVNIIQHPLGGPKQIAIYNNIVMYSDENVVQYMNDTMRGSSGSPVFNIDWEVVALHHGGGWIKEPITEIPVARNQGTNIFKIVEFMNKEKLV